MKKIWLAVILVLGLASLGISAHADGEEPYVEGEVLVRVRGEWGKRSVPPGQEKATVENLRKDLAIEYAEVNGFWSAIETLPNDSRWQEQYGPVRIKGPQAWDLSLGSDSIVISVIDTGVACTHEDLVGKCVPGFDFVNNDTDPFDDHGHGTHVSGIAAASTNNGIGVAGICWLCKIQPVKVLSNFGSGTWENVAAGIRWATDNGADVINMSLGGTGFSQIVQDAVIYAESRGVLIFAAAGNTGGEGVLYPAKYPQVIAVAATDSADNRASFSTYGVEVELAAPGVSNISSVPLGPCSLCDPSGYRFLSGTSMATPHAAGVGALLLSFRPALTNFEAREILHQTAADKGEVGWDKFYGFGLVDAFSALSFGGEFPTPTPTPEPTQTPDPTHTPTPGSGIALCGKYTGGLVLLSSASPYFLVCDVDVKGGLTALDVEIQLRGFSLSATGTYFRNTRVTP